MRLAWLFLAWTLAEIGLFAGIGGRIGVLATWAEVLGSFAVAIWLIRWQKRSLTTGVFRDIASLGQAVRPAAHSALIVLAAVLLMLPGFLGDAVGLVLLLPWVRNRLIDHLAERTRSAAQRRGVDIGPQPHRGQGEVIDALAQEVPPPAPKPGPPSGWTKP